MKKNNIILISSILCAVILVTTFYVLSKNDKNEYPDYLIEEINTNKEANNFIEINKNFDLGSNKIFIYGVSFKSGDRKKPIVYYHAYENSGNTTLNLLDPPITGGGGTVGKEIFDATKPVEDILTIQVIFTEPLNRKEYSLTLDLA